MLDFGFSEILLTSAIALVVLGPERLPKAARTVGNWMGRARLMARQLSDQLEREVNAEELLRGQSRMPVRPDQAPPLRPDQPPLIAPASVSMPPPAAPPDAPAPPAPVIAAQRPKDGHATTAAAMHPPAPSASGSSPTPDP